MNNPNVKKIVGEVLSSKMDKSVVIKVDRVKRNKLYKKNFTISKKIVADSPKNKFKQGDIVTIVQTKPISKTKKYKVVGLAKL